MLNNLLLHMGDKWMVNGILNWLLVADSAPDATILLQFRSGPCHVIMLLEAVVKSGVACFLCSPEVSIVHMTFSLILLITSLIQNFFMIWLRGCFHSLKSRMILRRLWCNWLWLRLRFRLRLRGSLLNGLLRLSLLVSRSLLCRLGEIQLSA